ncbi:SGNH/GDSL hydrolase family protein [Bradyrhizobium sp. 195]|uniref:SGNH/GDSL hydrolase family protein n=1 Tax=Bradyrhizobium sp. 195 TaxID=2782662 RepID=UPI00200141AA|nr:SGNH/GDSL hydrolase family protein [Bradyrhizobium sp. 195]UPK29780.1 SGNH/GDSL hydrolase family protein [Bradyrhizobium sp. 195]
MKPWQIVMTFLVYCLASDPGALAEAGAEERPLTVVALGTSLTHSGGWLKPLETQLSECLDRSVNVLNFGRDGATSDWGVAVLEDVVHAGPDVVLIEFSINDAALTKGTSLRRSRENVKTIVLRLRDALPRLKIFLMTMNPAFGPRAWIRPQIAAYYDVYRTLAAELDVGYIDNLPDWNNLTELRARIPDGLHPVPEWAGRILVPTIARAIASTECVETRTKP